MWLRFLVSSIVTAFLFISPVIALYASPVYYLTGMVTSFTGTEITIGGKQFHLYKNCQYERHVKKNGAFFVEKGTSRDVTPPVSAVVRVNGTVVDQIAVEEWKR